ncbi:MULTISPECIES: SDR family NAD(P)-dependent oxidoreductase [unclassified Bradyrhizobium]|uniref:SDR family NAD(P)-dependent oxidoreductase n=1 Tax=unclassified Bradyrhizobium TaxID=2631580 RepID=UPI0021120381|nr:MULTISPECIES: SDR family NAD(P)-dependent oxidoreductase [unclassified Bradyrhizobium]
MFASNGKTALVTGGSRGIGRATAIALAEAGAQVLVHYGSAADEALKRTDHSSYCPFKGEAYYFSIPSGGLRARQAGHRLFAARSATTS